MKPATMRLVGIIFMLAAAVLMILNLRRVANFRSYWVALPLFIIGLIFVTRSKVRYR
jgi:hypothetical protein